MSTSFDRSTLTLDWVLDRRDDPLRPTRGLRAQLGLAASGDGDGAGGRRVLEPRAGLSLYRPLGGAGVLAARIGAAGVATSGAASAPLDALFLGGPLGIRGFATGSVGARDDRGRPLLDENGFRRGGERSLEAAVEARFPLASGVSGAIFVDAGQVWAEGQGLDEGRARVSAGLELWLQPRWLPLPLRLTWAENLDPLPDEEFDRFLIGFGASF